MYNSNYTFLSPPLGIWCKLSNDPHFGCAISRKFRLWVSIYASRNHNWVIIIQQTFFLLLLNAQSCVSSSLPVMQKQCKSGSKWRHNKRRKGTKVKCWCGYLSGARCRLFACGPADTTAIPQFHRLLPHLNPDLFYLSGTGLPRLSWKRGR